MGRGDDHITKKELHEELKKQTEDIVGTLTDRIEAGEKELTHRFDGLERHFDSFEIGLMAILKRMEGKIDEVLTAALDYHALDERITRLEQHLHLRKPTGSAKRISS